MPESLPTARVTSPCTKMCTLNPQDICVGCGRQLSEIAQWARLSSDEQIEVCRKAARRLCHEVVSDALT